MISLINSPKYLSKDHITNSPKSIYKSHNTTDSQELYAVLLLSSFGFIVT